MKELVIACHPDDEILGVGGTLIKHAKQGTEVYICILTKAYQPEWTPDYMTLKIEEQSAVDSLIGVTKRFNLDLPTVKLNTLPHGKMNKLIQEVVDEVKPNRIYTHSPVDLNWDHRLAFQSALVVTRPPSNIELLCFETLSETEWGHDAFRPNIWVDITDEIDVKVEAFKLYKSEVKVYPHPRSVEGIRYLAGKRGSEACFKYGEAFQLIRSYNLG